MIFSYLGIPEILLILLYLGIPEILCSLPFGSVDLPSFLVVCIELCNLGFLLSLSLIFVRHGFGWT